jgi:RNA polymerase sigma-70 factor (ECF subfamily)
MPRLAPPPRLAPTAPPPVAADDALLLRLRAGDRGAFAALVRRHGGALLRFARVFVKSPALAEDLVQETWLAALEGLEGFQGKSSLRTWLFRILAPPDEGEEPNADRFDQDGTWNASPETWSEENPERMALGVETRAAIEAAIAELPEAQRAVITLRDIEGLDTDEICNLLAITVTNQRVLLHRARARVRQALERHLGGER